MKLLAKQKQTKTKHYMLDIYSVFAIVEYSANNAKR